MQPKFAKRSLTKFEKISPKCVYKLTKRKIQVRAQLESTFPLFYFAQLLTDFNRTSYFCKTTFEKEIKQKMSKITAYIYIAVLDPFMEKDKKDDL